MSAYIAKTTRAIHAAAVRLHLAGLRATVSEAAAAAAGAEQEVRRAAAVVNSAQTAHRTAQYNRGKADAKHNAVRYAAEQEARNIGGEL